MREYLITWQIEVTAEGRQQAAELALRIMRDPDSVATVFGVEIAGEDGAPVLVDVEG